LILDWTANYGLVIWSAYESGIFAMVIVFQRERLSCSKKLHNRFSLKSRLRQETPFPNDYLFPSRVHESPHLGTRQYARILDSWIKEIGLDPTAYGTHTMRRTKASLIYRRTKNIRAVQLLLGHTKLESTVRYLGIEVEDALELSEQTEI